MDNASYTETPYATRTGPMTRDPFQALTNAQAEITRLRNERQELLSIIEKLFALTNQLAVAWEPGGESGLHSRKHGGAGRVGSGLTY